MDLLSLPVCVTLGTWESEADALSVGLEDVVCVPLDEGIALGVSLWLGLGEHVGLFVPPCEAVWVIVSECEPACDRAIVNLRPPVIVCVELKLPVVL